MLKKIILNVLIVIVTVFVLDFVIGRSLRYFYFKEKSGLHQRTTYSMETTNAEVLVFGSSRANHHYVPVVFEDSLKKTFYNLGRDGNGIFFQIALLNSVLKRYTPKVIILEYSGEFEKGNFEFDKLSSLLPYYRTHKEIRGIIDRREPLDKIKLVSEIYPFNSQALTIVSGNTKINKKGAAGCKGYVPLYGEWHNELDSALKNNSYKIDTNKINTFREFIVKAKNLGVQVFVVRSPIFRKLSKSQGIRICYEVCSAEKIPFWDFSADTSFLNNKSLFQDIVHLNDKGATAFSKLVVSKIKDYKTN
jgi:hypothetical protein